MPASKSTYDSDVRFGSSFLDITKHEKSVLGEIMTDKLTGEVYIKRPQDGKLISFRQKSHTVYEAVQEFNIQYQSSIGFAYPEDPGSYLLGTKFIVDEYLERDEKKDILLDNHTFNTGSNGDKAFKFEVSNKTNGFFIKPITRLGDRNVCGYLAGQFSEHEYINFSTVVRSFPDWLDLSTLYDTAYLYTEWKALETWSSGNALVDCTVHVTGADKMGNVLENVKDLTVPININEYSCIRFPEDYKEEMTEVYSIFVTINKVYAPKLQYERYLANDSNATSGISSVVDRMLEIDDRVVLNNIELFYFISGGAQLPTDENTVINQCFDVEFLDKAMVYLSTASGARAIQSQPLKPEVYPIDSMWAEELTYIEGNVITKTDAETNIHLLEKSLYTESDDFVEYTEEPNNAENILIKEISYSD